MMGFFSIFNTRTKISKIRHYLCFLNITRPTDLPLQNKSDNLEVDRLEWLYKRYNEEQLSLHIP